MDEQDEKPKALEHIELVHAVVNLFGSMVLLVFIIAMVSRFMSLDFPGEGNDDDADHWKPRGWKPGRN